MIDFLAADLGGDRVRRDDEDESVGPFDARFDFFPPVRREGNAFPIDPGVYLLSTSA